MSQLPDEIRDTIASALRQAWTDATFNGQPTEEIDAALDWLETIQAHIAELEKQLADAYLAACQATTQELGRYWPSIPNLDGHDLFLNKYGPPTGKEEEG